jgi:hypothetical protein
MTTRIIRIRPPRKIAESSPPPLPSLDVIERDDGWFEILPCGSGPFPTAHSRKPCGSSSRGDDDTDTGAPDMTAVVFPFPIVRRRGLIEKKAAYAESMNQDSAIRYVERQLTIQCDVMRRRGIAENLIDRELYRMAKAKARE